MCFTFAQHCTVIDLSCSYTVHESDFGAKDDNLRSNNKWQYYQRVGHPIPNAYW